MVGDQARAEGMSVVPHLTWRLTAPQATHPE
jgi:hypothetical protein